MQAIQAWVVDLLWCKELFSHFQRHIIKDNNIIINIAWTVFLLHLTGGGWSVSVSWFYAVICWSCRYIVSNGLTEKFLIVEVLMSKKEIKVISFQNFNIIRFYYFCTFTFKETHSWKMNFSSPLLTSCPSYIWKKYLIVPLSVQHGRTKPTDDSNVG